MADLAKLVVKLEAQTAKYQRELEQSNKKLKRFEKNTKKSIGNIKVAFGALGGAIAFKKIFEATAKQEEAYRQLEQGIKSTNKAVGFSAKELAKYASELQAATKFGDEDIIQAQAQLVSFTSITGEQFKRTTALALDMSERFKVDLKSASLQLGKALNDPVANLSALSRAGIQFTKEQRAVVKSLVETGRLGEAQNLILKELETQFGGSARAARDTFGGALAALSNNLGDLLEGDGSLNEAKDSIESLNKQLSDPKTKLAAQKLTGVLIDGFAKLTSILAEIPDFATWLGEEIAAAISGPNDLIRINEALAEKTKSLALAQEQYNAALEKTSTSGFGFNIGSDPKIIQARIDALNAEIKTLNDRKSVIEEYGGNEKPSLTGIDSQVESGGGSTGTVTDTSAILTEVTELQKIAAQIIQETTPQIEKIQARVLETAELFAKGMLTEEQAVTALNIYSEQIVAITDAEQIAHEEKLTRLQENFASELELLTLQKEQRLALLEDEKTRQVLSEQEVADLKLKINEDYAKAKEQLDSKSGQSALAIAENAYTGILSVMASAGKQGFEQSKKGKKVQALIATKDAAINAYDSLVGIPIIGPALAVAAALSATKFGMSQVSAISSAQYGSGGSGGSTSAPSISTSATSTNFQTPSAAGEVNNSFEQSQQIAQSRQLRLEITTDDFTGQPMRKLAQAFNDEVQDMGYEFSIRARSNG